MMSVTWLPSFTFLIVTYIYVELLISRILSHNLILVFTMIEEYTVGRDGDVHCTDVEVVSIVIVKWFAHSHTPHYWESWPWCHIFWPLTPFHCPGLQSQFHGPWKPTGGRIPGGKKEKTVQLGEIYICFQLFPSLLYLAGTTPSLHSTDTGEKGMVMKPFGKCFKAIACLLLPSACLQSWGLK